MDQAEKFKEGLSWKTSASNNNYTTPYKPKDLAKMYVVFKVRGKTIGDHYNDQSIDVEIVDYICFWFIDAGLTEKGRIRNRDKTFEELARYATEIIVFKK